MHFLALPLSAIIATAATALADDPFSLNLPLHQLDYNDGMDWEVPGPITNFNPDIYTNSDLYSAAEQQPHPLDSDTSSSPPEDELPNQQVYEPSAQICDPKLVSTRQFPICDLGNDQQRTYNSASGSYALSEFRTVYIDGDYFGCVANNLEPGPEVPEAAPKTGIWCCTEPGTDCLERPIAENLNGFKSRMARRRR